MILNKQIVLNVLEWLGWNDQLQLRVDIENGDTVTKEYLQEIFGEMHTDDIIHYTNN